MGAYKRDVPGVGNVEPVVPRTLVRIEPRIRRVSIEITTADGPLVADPVHAEWMREHALGNVTVARAVAINGGAAADVIVCPKRKVELVPNLRVGLLEPNEHSLWL